MSKDAPYDVPLTIGGIVVGTATVLPATKKGVPIEMKISEDMLKRIPWLNADTTGLSIEKEN